MDGLYSAYGLTIQSDVSCPELRPGSGAPQVTIRYGKTPDHLDQPRVRRVCVEVSEDQTLLKLERVAGARYWIKNGSEIIVGQVKDVDPDTLRLFLLSSGLSAVLYQRNILPLHGTAVSKNDDAIVLAGDSGAGKSTLALALVRRGYRILTDDLCPLTFDANGTPLVQPGIPRLKLWADTLSQFGIKQPLQRVRPELDKYALPMEDYFSEDATPLSRIYVLQLCNDSAPSLRQLSGLQKLGPLRDQQMGDDYLSALGKNSQWMNWLAMVGQKVKVVLLNRPEQRFCVEEMTDLIEADLQS